ncbi:MAG: hypothetical protein ACOYIO_02425 [Eubacteriales bacterium]|jgi:predicted transcriptional regulator
MKKTLYSLMLSDDVMREIDLLAHRMGTNRSSLVNRILAEHVSVRTPEQQANDIFSGIERLLAASRELVPLFAPNTGRVAVRSSLEYKYHPTIRYDVELASGFMPGEPIGTLSVNFRTQSQGLLELLSRFFRCLERIETHFLPTDIAYSLDVGRFTRTLAYPAKRNAAGGSEMLDAEEISKAITDYVSLIDRMIKACIGGADARTLTDMYAADLEKRTILL